jgi:hypothetical protein
MADPILSGYVAMTNWLARAIPIAAAPNLIVAGAAELLGRGDHLALYVLAAVTLAAGIPILLRLQLGKRGVRSTSDLGFSSNRNALRYSISWKGYDGRLLALMAAAFFLVFFLSSEDNTGAMLLSFATFWSVGVLAFFTRCWPADEATRRLKTRN